MNSNVLLEGIRGRIARLSPYQRERLAVRLEAEAERAGGRASAEGAAAGRLVAYVIGDGTRPLDPITLRRELEATLPDYMVPSDFVFLSAWPLTPNGKIDRHALPPPERQQSRRAEPPAGSVEEELMRIWKEVLRVDRIGREESFFDLGGHSLLAIQVLARMRERFGTELGMRAFFQAPTIAGLAAALKSTGKA